MKVELGKFLEVMGIPYKDIHLFKEAFTHPSYTNENKGKNYERLEFLGNDRYTPNPSTSNSAK